MPQIYQCLHQFVMTLGIMQIFLGPIFCRVCVKPSILSVETELKWSRSRGIPREKCGVVAIYMNLHNLQFHCIGEDSYLLLFSMVCPFYSLICLLLSKLQWHPFLPPKIVMEFSLISCCNIKPTWRATASLALRTLLRQSDSLWDLIQPTLCYTTSWRG